MSLPLLIELVGELWFQLLGLGSELCGFGVMMPAVDTVGPYL